MAFEESSGGNGLFMPVAPAYGGGGFGGGDGWWIILLLLACGGWGNGFGGGYGGAALGIDFPWVLNGQQQIQGNMADGFRDQMISSNLGGSDSLASTGLVVVLFIVFVVLDVKMWRWGLKRIKRLQERSQEQNFDRQHPLASFKWDDF